MTWTRTIQTQTKRVKAKREQPRVLFARVLTLLVAICLWWLIAAAELLPSKLVPAPWPVMVDFVRLLTTSAYWHAVGATVIAALVGLIAAAVVGIPLGVLVGRFRKVEYSTSFLVDFGRAFPTVALVGVLVLMLGRGIEMKGVLVFLAVVFPLIIQTQHGVQQVDPMVRETCHSFKIPQALYIRKVLFPAAAPSIMTGLRLAASVSVLVTIAAEVLTNAPGVGQRIAEAQLDGNAPRAFAYILTAGILGYLVNIGVGAVQARVIRWRTASIGED